MIILKENETIMIADKEYLDWLENMLIMLSGNFMDLANALKAADAEALKKLPLPYSTETRRAIRLMAEYAEVSNKRLEPYEVEAFANEVIAKHTKKTEEDNLRELESLIESGYSVMYCGNSLDTAKIDIRDYSVAIVHQEKTIYAVPKEIYASDK